MVKCGMDIKRFSKRLAIAFCVPGTIMLVLPGIAGRLWNLWRMDYSLPTAAFTMGAGATLLVLGLLLYWIFSGLDPGRK